MNEEELKKLWQRQPLRNPPSAEQVISAMQSQATQFRRILGARDLRELWACAIVIVIFGIFYFTVYLEPISRLGDLVVIGGAIFIAWKLVYTKRKNPPAPPGASVVESLRAELNAVRAQSRLLGSVLWWYLLPLTVGEVIATWGLPISAYAKIPSILVFIAINGFIYWLNQWARAKQLLPMEAQLESMLRSAETGSPFDQTHVANLRPIVLSMAAAEHVKPVEFRVAFSQIAIYGMSGIIGIWVIWMGDRTLNNQQRNRAQIPATFAASVGAAETNRYSIVARKLIDQLNAGNYSAAQKLYNRDMSKAFPPTETSDFYARLARGYGKIESFDGPLGPSRGWSAFQLHGQRGELTMSLALDGEDKIAGVSFKPAQSAPLKLKSFVVQFFAWRNLAWLPIFVLGGFLYCWLLQKMTERAVGISALGIHLMRGQVLILWDEMKEVRPLRVINIRSLWLVRENGEKSIMPWSSLEGQSELKAAVERFAPGNHPIRKFLTR
jgi:hypothetical protein